MGCHIPGICAGLQLRDRVFARQRLAIRSFRGRDCQACTQASPIIPVLCTKYSTRVTVLYFGTRECTGNRLNSGRSFEFRLVGLDRRQQIRGRTHKMQCNDGLPGLRAIALSRRTESPCGSGISQDQVNLWNERRCFPFPISHFLTIIGWRGQVAKMLC